MEAGAALGLAGNVVQFLDFGQKLSRTIFEIWKSSSGLTTRNAAMETLIETFMTGLDSVCSDLGQYHTYLAMDFGHPGKGAGDLHHIQQMVNECRDMAADLMKRIDKLRVSGSGGKRKNFLAAIKSLWSESEISNLEAQFSKFRHELETRVLFSLRASMNSLESQQQDLFELLLELRHEDQFQELQTSISAKIEETIRSQLRTLPHWPSSTSEGFRSQFPAVSGMDPARADMDAQDSPSAFRNEPTLPLETVMAQRFSTLLKETEADVLRSISFPVLFDREDAISDPELNTFDWIFRSPRSHDRPWDNFREWLETGESCYWISGKAGSGKSTLMKYLRNHSKTMQGLLKWAGDTKVLLASFFFWYGGYELQKSQEGLLRGLLYSCLKDHRQLIPLVLPETAGLSEIELETYWTMPRLRRAFLRLVSQRKFDLKFCFLIDGLDEYAGPHAELADFVQEIASHANTKVCASSRPLAVFDPAFAHLPRLVLQNLTFDDIRLYVERRLSNNAMMRRLEDSEPQLSSQLTYSIVVKASGVFLWVRLVVNSLLEGLSNCDVGLDLKRRLDDLPPDLEDLYWHMVDRVTPQWYLEEGFRLLRMLKVAGGHLLLFNLYLAELAVTNSDWSTLERKAVGIDTIALQDLMIGRLKSRCLGLLEIKTDVEGEEDGAPVVTFIHKSVYEFLDTDGFKSRILKVPGQSHFRPEVALMRATLLRLKLVARHIQPNSSGNWCLARDDFVSLARPLICKFLEWASLAEKAYSKAEVDLIDELERTADGLWSRVGFRSDDENWVAAPRVPDSTCLFDTDDEETFDPTLTWSDAVRIPLNRPIPLPSFDALTQLAGLKIYANSKGRPEILFAQGTQTDDDSLTSALALNHSMDQLDDDTRFAPASVAFVRRRIVEPDVVRRGAELELLNTVAENDTRPVQLIPPLTRESSVASFHSVAVILPHATPKSILKWTVLGRGTAKIWRLIQRSMGREVVGAARKQP